MFDILKLNYSQREAPSIEYKIVTSETYKQLELGSLSNLPGRGLVLLGSEGEPDAYWGPTSSGDYPYKQIVNNFIEDIDSHSATRRLFNDNVRRQSKRKIPWNAQNRDNIKQEAIDHITYKTLSKLDEMGRAQGWYIDDRAERRLSKIIREKIDTFDKNDTDDDVVKQIIDSLFTEILNDLER